MKTIGPGLREKIEANWKTILLCVLFTFFWGFSAHGYMFLHNNLTHDSLGEFLATKDVVNWKLSLGRIFWPAYVLFFRGKVAYPWLIGLLTLAYISLAVFLVGKIFDICSKGILFLVAGVLAVNTTVTAAAATYIHDLDCDMLAMLLAVVSVYCWKTYRHGYLWGMIPIPILLGLYQSYISVTITLLMVLCILALLHGETFREVMGKGLKGILMLMGGGAAYFVIMKLALVLTGVSVSSGNANSIDAALSLNLSNIAGYVLGTWFASLKMLLNPPSAFPPALVVLTHGLLIGGTGIVVLLGMARRKMPIPEMLLTLALILLMPLGMNVSRVLTGNKSHDLMHYALWLQYLFELVVIVRFFSEMPQSAVRRWMRRGAAGLIALVVLWGNVRLANEAYLVKDYEQDAILSYMTRIVGRVEAREDYVQGQTPVALVGQPDIHGILAPAPEWGRAYDLAGMWCAGPWGGEDAEYFRYVLMNYANVVTGDALEALEADPIVKEMPAYPAKDSIAMVDGVIVVKLG